MRFRRPDPNAAGRHRYPPDVDSEKICSCAWTTPSRRCMANSRSDAGGVAATHPAVANGPTWRSRRATSSIWRITAITTAEANYAPYPYLAQLAERLFGAQDGGNALICGEQTLTFRELGPADRHGDRQPAEPRRAAGQRGGTVSAAQPEQINLQPRPVPRRA